MAASTSVFCQVLCRDRGTGVLVRLDRMYAVAIGANRGLPVAASDSLSVNALAEFVLSFGMALGTCSWNIELKDRRFGIGRRKNFVRAMAVCTDSCFFHTVGHGAS